ncbi:MAG TPA: DUF6520 family protein [Chryseosolibacter sp.]
MKKIRIILSAFTMTLAIAGAFALNTPSTTAWFEVDEDTGVTGAYIGPSQPACQVVVNKFCAAEYPSVINGQPVGDRIQLLSNAKRITP